MKPLCKQCGRPIDLLIETVHHGLLSEAETAADVTYYLHQGGCPPGYTRPQPTRKTPR